MSMRELDPKIALMFGQAAQEAYSKNPVDIGNVRKSIDGAIKLLTLVDDDLEALEDDKVQRNTVNLLAHGISAMTSAHEALVWAHVMSGQATEDMLGAMRKSFEVKEE